MPLRDYDEAMAGYRSAFNPDASFLGVCRVDGSGPDAYRGADVVVIGAPFESATGYRPGARFGPQAIRRADYLPMLPHRPHLALGVDPFSVLEVIDAGDVAMPPGDIAQALTLLENQVAAIAGAGAIPVVLGGDHSVALAGLAGLARHHGHGNFAVIRFDAHAETGEIGDLGAKYSPGTAMRRIVESAQVRGDRLFQVGLRGYWPGPRTLAWARERGRWYTMDEVGRRGLATCIDEVLARVGDVRGVFLSIDVDVVDPAMAPGTGTPEPGGLTSRELLEAVRRCAVAAPLIGMEVVEVSPPYDTPSQVTAALANRVVLEALSGHAWRRTRARPRT